MKLIPPDKAHMMINRPVHVAGCSPGCVWILRRIENGIAYMETPKTKKPAQFPVERLQYVRRFEALTPPSEGASQ